MELLNDFCAKPCHLAVYLLNRSVQKKSAMRKQYAGALCIFYPYKDVVLADKGIQHPSMFLNAASDAN